jgi:hypothetical protein
MTCRGAEPERRLDFFYPLYWKDLVYGNSWLYQTTFYPVFCSPPLFSVIPSQEWFYKTNREKLPNTYGASSQQYFRKC